MVSIATAWGRRPYSACFHYRQFTPLAALQERGNEWDCILYDRMPVSKERIRGANFHLIYFKADNDLYRHIIEENRTRLLPHNRTHVPLFIYDADDDTDFISPYNPNFPAFGWRINDHICQPGEDISVRLDDGRVVVMHREKTADPTSRWDLRRNRAHMRLVPMTARACQGVTVATEELAKVYRERYFCKNVHVFPNSLLPEDYPEIRVQPPEHLTILWEGGSAHLEDWLTIQQPLIDVLQARPNVRLISWGQEFSTVTKLLPAGQHMHLPWIAYEKYTLRLATLGHTITIAPLLNNQFNRCKSHIRWLESSAISTPAAVLAVNLPPYQVIKHGETGMLYNTPDEFRDTLLAMIDDPAQCQQLAARAHEFVWDVFPASKTTIPLEAFYRRILYAYS